MNRLASSRCFFLAEHQQIWMLTDPVKHLQQLSPYHCSGHFMQAWALRLPPAPGSCSCSRTETYNHNNKTKQQQTRTTNKQ
jgi:hypothetical protein